MLVFLAGVVGIDLLGVGMAVPVAPDAATVHAALVMGAPIDSPVDVPEHDPDHHGTPDMAAIHTEDGTRLIDFELIAGFEVEPDPEAALEGIPEPIRALHGTRVALAGFMIPTEFDDGRVSRFLIARSPLACCFGATPAANELVDAIPVDGGTVEHEFFRPVLVTGTFRIIEPTALAEGVYGLYELDQDTLSVLAIEGF